MDEDLSDANKPVGGAHNGAEDNATEGGAKPASGRATTNSAQPLRSILSLTAALGMAFCGYYLWQEHNRPVIAFDTLVQDLGQVEEGIEVKCDFKVANHGGAPLDIQDVKSSCGCTFPVWRRKRLLPGQSAILPVTVDTAMKQDKVEKTMDVISNDPDRGFVTLTIKLDVKDPHKDMGKGKIAKIFSDQKCMVCHVDQGLGLAGKELFEADCAMCHRTGVHGKAAVGPILEDMDLSAAGVGKILEKTISHGSPHNRSMPGFLSDAGGPLAQSQIDSLVKYLQSHKGKAHDH